MKYDALIDQLIFLKDELKSKGYSWKDYECINEACRALNYEQKRRTMMINNVNLIGRMTKDPELRYTPNGTAVATFTLAIDRMRKDANGNNEVDFINIVVWQKLAENVAKYTAKGSLVAVQGRIQVRNYEDKEGNKRYVTEVVADTVRFLNKVEKDAAADPEPAQVTFDAEDIPF